MIRLDEQFPPLKGGVAERPRAQQDMAELLTSSNVWFDESRGLTRRPSMRLVSRDTTGPYSNLSESTYAWGTADITAANYAAQVDGRVVDAFELAYEFRGEQYAVSVPRGALGTHDAPVYAVRKSDGKRIVSPIPGTGVAAALANGCNAAAVVGDLLVLAPRAADRADSHPTYTVARPWAVQANQQNLAAWVRGGAFARPYKLTLVRGDSRMWVQYTTLSEAYPAKLDTSDIPTTDPEYSKKVNDRTNAYNAAATAWLAAALADITPENIATRLAAALNASGYLAPGATATAVGSSVLVTDPSIEELFVEDGGDGSLIMAAGNTIPSAGAVVAFHLPGKILKVLPGSEGGADSFYLKAVAKDQSTGAMTQVSWEECAGEELVAAPYFVYGAMSQAASPSTYPEGRLHLALSIADLNTAAGTDFPEEVPNVSGDMTTNPPPAFYSREISAMAAFQDRLVVVCAGGAVSASQPGDYLNFFRTSMLTSLPRDPVEFTIIGGEGDVVRHTVKYDRNLLLVGERQYMLPGRNPLVRGQAAASIFSDVPDMAVVEPVPVGPYLVFARYSGGRTTLHALRPGRVVEANQVVDLTTQAPNLITERPVRLLAIGTPEAVLLQTADAGRLYLVTLRTEKGELSGGAMWPWSLAIPTDAAAAYAPVYEQFAAGLTGYSTVSGNAGLFTVSGDTLTVASQTSATVSRIKRVAIGAPISTVAAGVEFRVLSTGVDDSAWYAARGATTSIAIVPQRDSQVDGGSRKPAFFWGAISGTVGPGPVTLNKWYRARIGLDPGVGITYLLEDIEAGTVFASGTFAAPSAAAVSADSFEWTADAPNSTGAVEFREAWFANTVEQPVTLRWAAAMTYQHQGAVNILWQQRTLGGVGNPYTVSTAYHLASLDFRTTRTFSGWWGARLGPLPFSGDADFDTFSLVPPPWTGEFEARADLVPPTYYTDKGFRVPIPSTGSGAMRQRHPLTLVAYRVHYTDTSYAKALVGSTIWWQRAAANPDVSPVSDGGWAQRQDSGTPTPEPATTATADFLSAFPVGRLVHQAGLSLRSVGKHPFTISSVQWMGALHTRSDRG